MGVMADERSTPDGGTVVREVFLNAAGEPVDSAAEAATIEVEVGYPDGTTARTYLTRS